MTSMTLTYLYDFFIFGLWANFFALIYLVCLGLYKATQMSEQEMEEYTNSIKIKDKYVQRNNTSKRRLYHKLLNLIPGYTVTYVLIFAYHAASAKGMTGMVRGIIEMEKFSFIPIVKFKSAE